MGLGLVAGLALGAGVWLVLGSDAPDQRRLEADQIQLAGLKAPGRPASILGALVAEAGAHPLFTLTTGPGAQPEPTIQVSGLSRTPVHRAALVSVNGGKAQWLGVGQSLSGVMLLDVQESKIAVETAFGRKDVDLDDGTSSQSASPPPAARPEPIIQAGGGRPSLAPASAPAPH
jgi:hypothetical protein